MRNLTIKRTKSFVGCLVSAKLFVEDAAGDTLIDGVSCRKLGELKNGEEKTFSISTDAVKIFAIADQVSRSYCFDCYPVPAGTEDVYLTGKNRFHPGAGNPFRFDGVTDPALLAKRKKGSNKGLLILIAAVIVGIAVGNLASRLLLKENNDPREFSAGGMSITLTEAFSETSFEGYTQCYESKEIAVFALREDFTLAAGMENLTLEEYGQLVIDSNGKGGTELLSEDGLTWFQYNSSNADGSLNYFYFAAVFKSEDAFWLIQFATPENRAEANLPLFKQWAKTVTFE